MKYFRRFTELFMVLAFVAMTGLLSTGASFKLSNVAGANVLAQNLNATLSAGYLTIYNGTDPGANGAITTQVAVANFTLPSGASNTLLNGLITFAAIANVTISNTQTAAWFRLYKSDGSTGIADGDVSTSAASINFNSVSFVSGATANLSSFTIQVPHDS